jgi:hypothetical protein
MGTIVSTERDNKTVSTSWVLTEATDTFNLRTINTLTGFEHCIPTMTDWNNLLQKRKDLNPMKKTQVPWVTQQIYNCMVAQ